MKAIPIIDLSRFYNINFSNCSSLLTIPHLDITKFTDLIFLFNNCSSLHSIPPLNTSNATDMNSMFYGCKILKTIPQLDTSMVTNMKNMFNYCETLTTIPQLDTSNVNNMYQLFYNCTSLTTIPQLDTSKVTNIYAMFYGCTSLTSLPLLDVSSVTNIGIFLGYSTISTLTDLGGFKNLKIDWNDGSGLARLPNLTYQSVMNVINNLYDFRSNGDTTTTRTLKLHANSLKLLTDDDKALATSKGWVLS